MALRDIGLGLGLYRFWIGFWDMGFGLDFIPKICGPCGPYYMDSPPEICGLYGPYMEFLPQIHELTAHIIRTFFQRYMD